MNKAFIFDLDGVLINNESIWEEKKQLLYHQLFGQEVSEKLGSTLGINMDGIYEKAVAVGANVAKEELFDAFYKLADDIYNSAPVPDGVDELVNELLALDYHIGIVSASPMSWITSVIQRLPFQNNIELIISLHERADLKHKPEPDGYLEAIRTLRATPKSTIILEDSNSGIKSAKASGAYTIGLKQNLVDGYRQEGADVYAENMTDVGKLVKKKSLSLG
jgi:mannitol-1-/sugar-/sorbitol-6-/2-deoxyglucose-6-phosphatase